MDTSRDHSRVGRALPAAFARSCLALHQPAVPALRDLVACRPTPVFEGER